MNIHEFIDINDLCGILGSDQEYQQPVISLIKYHMIDKIYGIIKLEISFSNFLVITQRSNIQFCNTLAG